jgi:hypothetical protein
VVISVKELAVGRGQGRYQDAGSDDDSVSSVGVNNQGQGQRSRGARDDGSEEESETNDRADEMWIHAPAGGYDSESSCLIQQLPHAATRCLGQQLYRHRYLHVYCVWA